MVGLDPNNCPSGLAGLVPQYGRPTTTQYVRHNTGARPQRIVSKSNDISIGGFILILYSVAVTTLVCLHLHDGEYWGRHFQKLEVYERGVLVMGQTGTGKSSLINSFIKVYDRDASSHQLQHAGFATSGVTMETSEINVTMRIWNAPGAAKKEETTPLAIRARFYDTRGFMDHYDDQASISKQIKSQFTEHGPVLTSVILVIKVDRMGPLAKQLHNLLRQMPKKTGIIMALTHCNDLTDELIGSAKGTFKNEIVKHLNLQTSVMCLRPWDNKEELYARETLDPLVLELRSHSRRWSFRGPKENAKYKLKDLKEMKIKELNKIAQENDIDVKGLYDQEEYLEVMAEHFGIKDEL